ncbi:MaoC dehydratase-like protein [Herbihabitans rhizosphaerae]|uniref:MaoC dehydratase-like protein n=1 Tax=Herbihabitans rhizosphaerae TaxID=1872711 RepID=A0A4Q7KGK4_9PSEU|nr:MaoC/PaaZ C-terminal domain-containing protein [Herbihabitans rhizosphaerae]RZS34239.1 MaoC dehydratase-like protein [Herbihabitans rhizosphaerae]
MGLDHNIIGQTEGPWTASWTADDALLYAVGIGAGQQDPTAELAFTTENTADVTQQVLPTFGIPLVQFGGPPRQWGDFDPALLVHAEQALALHRPIPPAGTVKVRRTVTEIEDKGKGALVAIEYTADDAESGEHLLSTRTSVFIKGEGGFGGERKASHKWTAPEREPDVVARFPTAVNQALVYRLTGDRNPLHSDPAFAARGGFERPILHGLATYGITARLLINELTGGDVSRVSGMDGRFTKPVLPGAELIVHAWLTERGALFQTRDGDGDVVLDRGAFFVK